jgi:hypothetical protein
VKNSSSISSVRMQIYEEVGERARFCHESRITIHELPATDGMIPAK